MQRRTVKGIIVCIAGLAGLSLASCNRSKVAKDFVFWPDSMHHEVPTCGPIDSARNASLPLEVASWATWNIPEYQDQQRFVTGAGQPYGPIACVAARQDLGKVNQTVFANPFMVAVVWVGPGALTPAYTQLKLTNGFNCVFVQKGNGANPTTRAIPALGNAMGRSDDRWRGFIVPSSPGSICATPGPASQVQAIGLEVDGAMADDYPPVARFMILNNWKPGIGVRCGEAWCVLGTPTDAMLPAPAHVARVPGTTGRQRTMFVVPGWYDEQQVAVPGTGTPPLKASLKATIVPDPGLDTYTITANFDTGFVRVAVVYFQDQPTDKYLNNFQFHLGSAHPDTLYLRHITTGTPHWVARVNNGSRYFRVMRTPHPPHITGTARWSWTDTDEVFWVRCDEGCCLVDANWSDVMAEVNLLLRQSRKSGWPG